MISIALYDDHPAMRHSLSMLFTHAPEFTVAGTYANAMQLIENCRYHMPDIILMDIDMPGMRGIEAVSLLQSHYPTIKVIMLTASDDNQYISQSICNGAVGYLLKQTDPDAILDAVRSAQHGGAPISPAIALKVLNMFRIHAPSPAERMKLSSREHEILVLLSRGFSYKMIAAETSICIDTVRFHIKKIYEKLHVHSMTEAVGKALKNKWI